MRLVQQREKRRTDSVGTGDRRDRPAALGGAGGDWSGTRTRRALKRSERKELVELRRENQRLQMRDRTEEKLCEMTSSHGVGFAIDALNLRGLLDGLS